MKTALWRGLLSGFVLLGVLLACALPGQPAATPATPEAPPAPSTSPPAGTAPPVPSATPPATATWLPPEHAIGVRTVDGRGEFFDRRSGSAFVPRGVNYVFVPAANDRYETNLLRVGVYDAARTRADFERLAGLGYNTVRVFLDHCQAGPGCIGDDDNAGLNPAYLDNIADLLAAARAAGLFVLFTSNDLPDQGGYAEEANQQAGDTFAGYRNAYYLTAPAVRATRRYWRDLLTGLLERRAPLDAVLGWQLLNEQWMFVDQPPLSLIAGRVETTTGVYDLSDPAQKRQMVAEGLIHYIAEMRAEILAHDPTALVTMGFFAPEIAAPGWYVDTAPLLAGAELDFFDFHAYPGDLSLAEHVQHFGMQDYAAKPILLGEYGAFRQRYGELTSAARALSDWVAESCGFGFDGWLHWAYYPTNPEVDDRTWGFTEEAGYLMELLAPANQPDPCTALALPSANLAFGRPVAASSALAAEAPALAVDENEASQWGAGSDAPQWLEVDLGSAARVTEIRLLVAQFPEGESVHRLFTRGPEAAEGVLVHEFSGFTRDGDWLVFTPAAPLEGVRFVRVYTASSPSWVSWREVQVLGEEGLAILPR